MSPRILRIIAGAASRALDPRVDIASLSSYCACLADDDGEPGFEPSARFDRFIGTNETVLDVAARLAVAGEAHNRSAISR